VTRYIDIQIQDARGRIRLLDDEAPRTAQAIWDLLPIEDKTIAVRWSGNAWRSDRDYALSFDSVENRPEFLQAGEIAYYPRLQKLCFAYGTAQWRGPAGEIRDMTLFGRVDQGLGELVAASERAHVEGSADCLLTRHAAARLAGAGKGDLRQPGRKMRVQLGNIEAIAELYEDQAPRTCEAVWNALPIEYGHVLHARFSGEEAFFPTSWLTDERENERFDCKPGDIGFWALGPSICFYYGKTTTITPGNVFARVTGNCEEFYRMAKRTWKDHNIPVRLERIETEA
jgi:hypothetical protein